MVSSIQHQRVSKRREAPARRDDRGAAVPGRSWASLQSGGSTRALRITPLWSAPATRRTAAVPATAIALQTPISRPRRLRRSSVTLGGLCRLCTSHAAALLQPIRSVDLPLYAALVVSLLLFSAVLVPDSRLMRLAQPGPSVAMPEASTRHALLARLAAPSGSQSHSGEPVVEAAQFQRLQVREYRLAAGDTLSGIAASNGLRIDTLASFNRITDARRIRVGDVFQIPNRDGLLHSVGRGESLSSIASRYGTTVNALLDANDLSSATITAGQSIFVPEARLSRTELQRVLGQLFIYPASGRLTSGYGMRNDPFTGIRRFHNGIDLAAAVGTPVRAAMAGRVVHVENQPGNYGRFVIIRHDGGYQTLYAHLDSYSVQTGQQVNQGQQIGQMGNTGRSTGPHLHFSVIKNGSFVDPMRYLR
ncbi:MAG: M23 family metallopeptidase [Spirochaetaceae bacterium]|nr:MAG: M23 family metallopeptidase [Spirochaetaceae bacterium]